MTTIRRAALLLLCVFLAGCLSVQSPEKFEVTIGPDDDGRPRRKNKSQWDIPADIASRIVGEGVEGFIFYAYDVLTPPGREVELLARVKAFVREADVEGITLTFHRLRDGKRIGRARTDENGYASIYYPARTPGDTRFFVKVARLNDEYNPVLRDLPPALLLVAVRQARTRFVVVDLDRTLVASSFFRVVLWDGGKPMPGSQRGMRRIAKKYNILYLTHRPNDLTRTSRLWMEDKGFPDGVLLLSTTRGMPGDSGSFKAKRLRKIRKEFPHLMYGIGDKDSDIEAYRDNGMKAIWIPHFKNKPKDLRKIARQMRSWRDPNVIVVENWRQIGKAIFGDYRRSTDQFADMLDARAQEFRKEDDD